jgi:phage tail-like protein
MVEAPSRKNSQEGKDMVEANAFNGGVTYSGPTNREPVDSFFETKDRNGRRDPAIKYLFSAIGPALMSRGGFSKISGIKEEIEVVEARDGQDPYRTRKLMGAHKGGTAVFSRGVVSNFGDFTNWFKLVKRNTPFFAEPVPLSRSEVLIGILGCNGDLARVVSLSNCWPSAYELGDLDARSSDVEVESLSIVFENLSFEDDVQVQTANRDFDLFVKQREDRNTKKV